MGKLFKNQQTQQMSPRAMMEAKYNAGRANLMLALAFTLINLILLLANGSTYFLFSIFVPYFVADLGMFLCGKYPAEYYTGELAGMEFRDTSFLVIALVIAAVVLAVYTLCWLLSSKHRVGWMIAALALFAIDSVLLFLIGGLSADMLIDFLFHIWVLYYLVAAVIAHFRLKNMPPEEDPIPVEINPEQPATEFTTFNDFPVETLADNPTDTSDNNEKTE